MNSLGFNPEVSEFNTLPHAGLLPPLAPSLTPPSHTYPSPLSRPPPSSPLPSSSSPSLPPSHLPSALPPLYSPSHPLPISTLPQLLLLPLTSFIGPLLFPSLPILLVLPPSLLLPRSPSFPPLTLLLVSSSQTLDSLSASLFPSPLLPSFILLPQNHPSPHCPVVSFSLFSLLSISLITPTSPGPDLHPILSHSHSWSSVSSTLHFHLPFPSASSFTPHLPLPALASHVPPHSFTFSARLPSTPPQTPLFTPYSHHSPLPAVGPRLPPLLTPLPCPPLSPPHPLPLFAPPITRPFPPQPLAPPPHQSSNYHHHPFPLSTLPYYTYSARSLSRRSPYLFHLFLFSPPSNLLSSLSSLPPALSLSLSFLSLLSPFIFVSLLLLPITSPTPSAHPLSINSGLPSHLLLSLLPISLSNHLSLPLAPTSSHSLPLSAVSSSLTYFHYHYPLPHHLSYPTSFHPSPRGSSSHSSHSLTLSPLTDPIPSSPSPLSLPLTHRPSTPLLYTVYSSSYLFSHLLLSPLPLFPAILDTSSFFSLPLSFWVSQYHHAPLSPF
ncbi:hypothetical protein C7M84_019734 [Penaeus vannamei]|uniref:Uncharacterized protein n=1 Tax=Penaeus vannamei TaxID=6689 RepID=A0A423U949_PENVA|nr:hypothetical protein C7M84_019734 [Penaeus vannamei]